MMALEYWLLVGQDEGYSKTVESWSPNINFATDQRRNKNQGDSSDIHT